MYATKFQITVQKYRMQYIADIFHLPSHACTVHEQIECFSCLRQFPMLKYNPNMPYTLAYIAYLNFYSQEKFLKNFLLLSFLCIYLGDSGSKTLFFKNLLWIDGSLQMDCGGCDKIQIWVSSMLIQERTNPKEVCVDQIKY